MTSRFSPEQHALWAAILKEWADKGRVIEGGWQAYVAILLQGKTELERSELRTAYFLGAEHLFSSIMQIMDQGPDPTENDMARMDLIHKELERFRRSLGN
jgi:hypothetical protein